MGVLKDKILTYSPEFYFPNEVAYTSTTIVNYGTVTPNSTWTNTGGSPTLNATGGPDGSGCWQFSVNNASEQALRSFGSTAGSGAPYQTTLDHDYSAGGWFRIPGQVSGTETSAVDFLRFGSSSIGSTAGVLISGTNAGKLQFTQPTTITTTNRYDDGLWHYYAERVSFDGTTYTKERYLDGSLFGVVNPTTVGTPYYFNMGDNSIINTVTSPAFIEIAHAYIAPYSAINATAIAEIWAAGQPSTGGDVTITETPATASAEFIDVSISTSTEILEIPATASALMTEPTIAVTAGDHTEITTSIIVSAEFLPNFAVYASQNINIVITEILNASIELINNVEVDTGSDNSFPALEFIASAEMMPAIVSEVPFIASATMPGGVASVTLSYFKLVKDLNPYLYINDGLSSPTNYGYQSGTFVKGTDLSTNQDGGIPLNLVAEGKSWKGSNTSNSNAYLTFETTDYADSFNNLLGTGTFAYEIWTKPLQFPDGVLTPDATNSFAILNSEKLELTLEDYYSVAIYNQSGQIIGYNTKPRYLALRIWNSLNTSQELTYPIDSSPFSLNNWNHVVINVFQSGINTNERLIQLWINGQILINQNISFTTWTDSTDKVNYILGSNAESGFAKIADMYYDELAIYSAPLTNSQIIQHNNFIGTLSPNYTHTASTLDANSEFGTHQFVVTSNITAIASPINGSADFAMPSILAVKNIDYSASALTASALNTDVTVFWGWTIYADPAIASAEKAPSYFLNSFYSDYVQANIAPYRYVTFDDANPYNDFGTDNDYSVVPTTVGGTIVNPGSGINGKSAKTAGLNYTTDGVILKESEWNDSWGTGQNSYHSAFWFRRAVDDNSTTGLRMLWNLNGYKDNQHVVLYQYQGKLHMQFNNGSGTWIEQDTGALDLFDYQRHFVLIEFDHTNVNNNTVRLYVDAVLRFTINLGTYTGVTLNSDTADSGPNDEANNHPRLSVGCLITPFAATALPVQPTNTKLIVDEIYWDKNSIDQTMVTNLYNAMPDQNNKNIITEPFIASDDFLMPAISTEAILSIDPATASAEFVEPSLYIERFVVTTADVMTASALMTEAVTFVPVTINADVMVATATFDSAGIIITIPGPTMYASALLKSEDLILSTTTRFGTTIVTNTFRPYRMMSPWLAYLRATDANSILPLREVK